MRMPDQRIDRDLRTYHAAEPAHLTEARDPHFDDGDLVGGRDAGKRHRHADLVVEVFIGLADLPAAGQDSGDHLLGRGLAHAARDADDRQAERVAVCRGDILQSALNVVRDDDASPLLLRDPFGQAADRALVECGGDIIVSVDALALISDKEIAGQNLAAVDDDAAELRRELTLAAVSSAAGFQRFFDGHSRHGLPRLRENVFLIIAYAAPHGKEKCRARKKRVQSAKRYDIMTRHYRKRNVFL